jgi:hypothetical protein
VATRITLIKRFPYRGVEEEYSNTYALTGSDPADAAAWVALMNALITAEKTHQSSVVDYVRAYGYDSDSETASAVWSRDLVAASETVMGTLSGSGMTQMPGDVAYWVRWKTSRLTSKGKPIYLRKYFHFAFADPADPDKIGPAQKTAALAFAAKMWDGTFLDGRTVRAPGQSSETIVGANASTYLTTRTLKRRGRRPTSP